MSVESQAQAVAPAAETEVVQSDSPVEQAKEARNDQAYNWAQANRQMKELDRQNRAMQEELASLKKTSAPPVEEDYGIKDEDIVEGRHVKDLKKQLRNLESYIKQKEVSTLDERLVLKHPDFAEVVTKENIELLKQTEPELAETLRHTPDPYQQGVAAYKLLKKMGIGQQATIPSRENQKATANSQKPVSVNAVARGNSAIGNAHLFENGLTPELKTQLWKEMQEAIKRA